VRERQGRADVGEGSFVGAATLSPGRGAPRPRQHHATRRLPTASTSAAINNTNTGAARADPAQVHPFRTPAPTWGIVSNPTWSAQDTTACRPIGWSAARPQTVTRIRRPIRPRSTS